MTDNDVYRDDWREQGKCRTAGVDMFPADVAGVMAAKRVCAGCPVREQCLQHALDTPEPHGMWGGKSERERDRIRRKAPLVCGTVRAYRAHLRRRERPCDACNEAMEAELDVQRARRPIRSADALRKDRSVANAVARGLCRRCARSMHICADRPGSLCNCARCFPAEAVAS